MSRSGLQFKLLDLAGLLLGVSIVFAFWRVHQDFGWISSITLVAASLYYFLHFRIRPWPDVVRFDSFRE